MLTVYTYNLPKPPQGAFDLSTTPLATLVEHAMAIHDHHTTGTLWFGYLDGWMLTPQEETILRKVLRKFPCSCISHFPLAFSQAWKNEVDFIHVEAQLHDDGDTSTNNNGGTVHDRSEVGH